MISYNNQESRNACTCLLEDILKKDWTESLEKAFFQHVFTSFSLQIIDTARSVEFFHELIEPLVHRRYADGGANVMRALRETNVCEPFVRAYVEDKTARLTRELRPVRRGLFARLMGK